MQRNKNTQKTTGGLVIDDSMRNMKDKNNYSKNSETRTISKPNPNMSNLHMRKMKKWTK